MTLDEILSKPYRRKVVAFFVIAIFSLIALRYWVLPSYDSKTGIEFTQGLAKFIEDLLTSTVLTLFVSSVILYFTPQSYFNARVIVLDASELKWEFSNALSSSNSWWFYGGCGRYFRSAVISKMSQRATAESSTKRLHAIILNPENGTLCDHHARYRNATSQGQRDGGWTASRVKCELVATIIVCLRAANKNGLLDIKLYLSDRFSTFRADISDGCAIETREDPKSPALKSLSNSDFYIALRTEFDILANQSIDISNRVNTFIDPSNAQNLQTTIANLSLPGLTFTSAEYSKIFSLINKIENPHA